MKLQNILDDIFNSNSKIKLLRLMFKYPDREFTEREIAYMINMSPNTVNLALKDLRSTNILNYKRISKTHIYKCNKNSILYNIVKNLFQNEMKIRDNLFSLLRKRLSDVQTSIVFGSFAEGSENFESDLDILIISENQDHAQALLELVTGEVLERFGTVISSIIMTPEKFKTNKNKPFIKQALLNGIIISTNE